MSSVLRKHRELFGSTTRPTRKRRHVRKCAGSQAQTPRTKLVVLDEFDGALSRMQEIERLDPHLPVTLPDIETAAHAAMRSRNASLLRVCRYALQKLGDGLIMENVELIDAEG